MSLNVVKKGQWGGGLQRAQLTPDNALIRVLEPSSGGEIFTHLSYVSRQIDRTCQRYLDLPVMHPMSPQELVGAVKTAKKERKKETHIADVCKMIMIQRRALCQLPL